MSGSRENPFLTSGLSADDKNRNAHNAFLHFQDAPTEHADSLFELIVTFKDDINTKDIIGYLSTQVGDNNNTLFHYIADNNARQKQFADLLIDLLERKHNSASTADILNLLDLHNNDNQRILHLANPELFNAFLKKLRGKLSSANNIGRFTSLICAKDDNDVSFINKIKASSPKDTIDLVIANVIPEKSFKHFADKLEEISNHIDSLSGEDKKPILAQLSNQESILYKFMLTAAKAKAEQVLQATAWTSYTINDRRSPNHNPELGNWLQWLRRSKLPTEIKLTCLDATATFDHGNYKIASCISTENANYFKLLASLVSDETADNVAKLAEQLIDAYKKNEWPLVDLSNIATIIELVYQLAAHHHDTTAVFNFIEKLGGLRSLGYTVAPKRNAKLSERYFNLLIKLANKNKKAAEKIVGLLTEGDDQYNETVVTYHRNFGMDTTYPIVSLLITLRKQGISTTDLHRIIEFPSAPHYTVSRPAKTIVDVAQNNPEILFQLIEYNLLPKARIHELKGCKGDLLTYIKTLPTNERAIALMHAATEDTAEHELFSAHRGPLPTSNNRGTLNDINELLIDGILTDEVFFNAIQSHVNDNQSTHTRQALIYLAKRDQRVLLKLLARDLLPLDTAVNLLKNKKIREQFIAVWHSVPTDEKNAIYTTMFASHDNVFRQTMASHPDLQAVYDAGAPIALLTQTLLGKVSQDVVNTLMQDEPLRRSVANKLKNMSNANKDKLFPLIITDKQHPLRLLIDSHPELQAAFQKETRERYGDQLAIEAKAKARHEEKTKQAEKERVKQAITTTAVDSKPLPVTDVAALSPTELQNRRQYAAWPALYAQEFREQVPTAWLQTAPQPQPVAAAQTTAQPMPQEAPPPYRAPAEQQLPAVEPAAVSFPDVPTTTLPAGRVSQVGIHASNNQSHSDAAASTTKQSKVAVAQTS